MKYPRSTNLLSNARCLRKNMTPQERHLWYDCLRYIKPRFRRQEIIGSYIADFYCHQAGLVIEVDGSQHYEAAGKCKDHARTAYFHTLGLKVLRFSNADVNTRFEGVCQAVLLALEQCNLTAEVTVEDSPQTPQSPAVTAPLKGSLD